MGDQCGAAHLLLSAAPDSPGCLTGFDACFPGIDDPGNS
jgi:hypothetical protein